MNITAILITAVVGFFVGFLWYGAIGGNLWIKLKEIPAEKVNSMKSKGMGPMIPSMFGNLVIQIVIASVMLFMLNALNVTDVIQAAMLAGTIWLGFVAPVLFNAVLWEERKIGLYIFDVLFYAVNLKITAMMLVWLA